MPCPCALRPDPCALKPFVAASLLCFVFACVALAGGPASQPASRPASQPASAPGAAAPASRPAGVLRIFPESMRLENARDRQQVVVVFEQAGGMTLDVTGQAVLRIEPSAVARFALDSPARTDDAHASQSRGTPSRSHVPSFPPSRATDAGPLVPVVVPLADGNATLTARWRGLEARAGVEVRGHARPRPISFRHDVEPVLMKAGCNRGACHGNARGQNGFRLTLFGYDPAFDYIALTRQLGARRIDPAEPQASLMLRKPLALAGHGGGKRLDVDSPEYRILIEWIRSGVPDDPPKLPKLTGIELMPRACTLPAGGRSHQLLVRARYSDGSDRDVTALAVFSSLNESVATVSKRGRVTTLAPGETFILARFGTFAVVTQIISVPDRDPPWPEGLAPANFVDEAVFAKLRRLRMAPSKLCDDATFVRRVYLDILGVLPTIDETRAFLADERPDKRARLIDALLERPEFPELWASQWADWLRIESKKLGLKGVQLYYGWLRDQIARGVPMDRIVRTLLTTSGGNFHEPAANFYLVEQQPTLMAENVAQVFLGIRIQCAQCHNHPFERWTMNDYYSFGAFFAQIGRKRGQDPRETIIFNRGSGEVQHKITHQTMRPKFLGGAVPEIPPGADRRAVLADWLTSPENPWFAKNLVNRVWAHFFGRGIIDPPDDVRVSNPPSHPELLDALARRFVASGYDMRQLVREICNSRTYQLASTTNASNAADARNFSHARVRRLRAEVLLDAISQVTGVPEKFAGLPLGARAVQVADAHTGSYFLTTFGRPERQSACTCERRSEPTLSQVLHLINGETIWRKLRSDSGRLARWLAAKRKPEQIVRDFYLAALCREPTADELRLALEHISQSKTPREGLEDVLWALLNSQEFVFNH